MKRTRTALVSVLLAALTVTDINGRQQPAPLSAEALLAAAIQQAQAEKKNIFIEFGASWCGPCVRLLAFLEAPATHRILADHFVVVSLTTGETGAKAVLDNPGARDLMRRLSQSPGIPYYAFLDPSGKKVSDSADGVGFPGPQNRAELHEFVALLGRMAPRLSLNERATLLDYLTNHSQQLNWTQTSRRLLFDLPDERHAEHVPSVSPDGHSFAFVDWDGGVSVHDSGTGKSRRMTAAAGTAGSQGYASGPVFSRDGKHLAYGWSPWDGADPQYELRIIDDPGTGTPVSRLLYRSPDIKETVAHDWTPDDQSIAVTLERKGGERQIGLVSSRDGSLRVLKSIGARRVETMAVSPDGGYLAFSVREPGSGASDIRVIAMSTSREIPAVVHNADDRLVGWSPDGEHLLFTSNRTGSIDLWAAFFNGDAFGALEIVTFDVGRHRLFGLSTTGSLFALAVPRETPPSQLLQASIDFAEGRVLTAPVEAVPDFVGRNSLYVSWSPDGQLIAYQSDRGDLGQGKVLVIRSMATGLALDLTSGIADVGPWPVVWSPDSRSVVVPFTGGLYRVDARTGESSFLAKGSWPRVWSPQGKLMFERDRTLIERDMTTGSERVVESIQPRSLNSPAFSGDGRALAYFKDLPAKDATGLGRGRDLVVRDVESGVERTLIANATKSAVAMLSPDGRFIATPDFDAESKRDVFLLVSTDGSRIRMLPKVGDTGLVPFPLLWAPDSRSVIAAFQGAKTTNLKGEYWWIPIDGRAPRKLDLGLEPDRIRTLAAQPGGNRVIFGQAGWPFGLSQVWSLEYTRPQR